MGKLKLGFGLWSGLVWGEAKSQLKGRFGVSLRFRIAEKNVC